MIFLFGGLPQAVGASESFHSDHSGSLHNHVILIHHGSHSGSVDLPGSHHRMAALAKLQPLVLPGDTRVSLYLNDP